MQTIYLKNGKTEVVFNVENSLYDLLNEYCGREAANLFEQYIKEEAGYVYEKELEELQANIDGKDAEISILETENDELRMKIEKAKLVLGE